ncbi:LPXTG-motif cell wall anchor domain-containing protein [Arthrobacter subterraneus]|uniref:LPXTG-motif cell wall anchor domain-containing protein n=1 Tax=Arthrobacter subterraneus TaxID=335973 RepID=A0A1G8J5E7_9MICC|nr:LPXTG cell wall anchor domain-containing protein [Arthrobacter subterraneus]SDI26464.1 LPXTG-motif cell wall anchor domain-containing protein [Arthrobacter subterraneus]
MEKIIAAVAIAGALTFVGAGAAQAERYPSAPVQGTVSDGTVAPGETVVFSSNEGLFIPGEIIDITVDFVAGEPAASGTAGGAGRAGAALGGPILPMAIVLTDTVTADAEGNFSWSFTPQEEGTYTLTATGRESGATVTATVAVDAPEAPVGGGTTGSTSGTTGGGLANTGIDSAMLLWGAAGIGALGLGAGSIFVARRRAGAEA